MHCHLRLCFARRSYTSILVVVFCCHISFPNSIHSHGWRAWHQLFLGLFLLIIASIRIHDIDFPCLLLIYALFISFHKYTWNIWTAFDTLKGLWRVDSGSEEVSGHFKVQLSISKTALRYTENLEGQFRSYSEYTMGFWNWSKYKRATSK